MIETKTEHQVDNAPRDAISVTPNAERGLVELQFGELITASLSASEALKLGQMLIKSAGVVIKAKRKRGKG